MVNVAVKESDERFFENSNRLMTYQEVADYLGVSKRVLYKWAKQGMLTRIVITSKCVRFEPDEVRKLAGEKET